MDEFDKILNQYISHHNKKFCLYVYKLTFSLEFNKNFIQSIETTYESNGDDTGKMKICLLSGIKYLKSRGYIFCNIHHITIDIIGDKCNMTYEYHINQPMQAVEMELNMIIAKNPQLINSLDRSKNHPLIRIYAYVPFNNYKRYKPNITEDYNNSNCTNNDNKKIEIIIPLLAIIPCGL